MALIKLAHNAVVARLIDAPEDVQHRVAELLSYRVDGADHLWSVNNGSWNGMASFFEYSTCSFPAGFVFMVSERLKAAGHQVMLIRKPHATPLGPENPVVDQFGSHPDYDYQIKALRQVEKYGRGIIQVGTGGGKSRIAKLIMARFNRITLFLTTRGVLLYQMADQLDALGMQTGQVGDGEMRVVRGVNLGMVQTLAQAVEEPDLQCERLAVIESIHKSRNKNSALSPEQITELAKKRFEEKAIKRNRILKFLELVEVVIGEEAHEAGGNSYYQILKHCKNATIRVALTATPFMSESAESNMRLMAAFGPKLIVITEKMLLDRGILARPYFMFKDCAPHPRLRKTSPWERAYRLGYLENENMHAELAADALKAKERRMPTLTLVIRKEHGELLEKLYRERGIRAVFLRGENNQNERRKVLDQLRDGKIDCVIGTTILDVGVDVPAICLVQLAGGYKAEVALRQRIGRGLRRKSNRPNVTFIIDYSCNANVTLREHAAQRRAIVEATPGFAEGILPPGQDFDWSIFEEQRAVA